MAEPVTYRETIEFVLCRIEERVYHAGGTYLDQDKQPQAIEAPPAWVLTLTPYLHRTLERNEHRRGVKS